MNAPLVNAVETGKNIKRLREEKGITVKELQKIFGFDTPQAIYRWQRGEILPCLCIDGRSGCRYAKWHEVG